MALLELEETIKPLSKREKVQLLRFLIDELAEEKSQDEREEMIDTVIFDERITEPDRPLSEYLAERSHGAKVTS